MFFKANCLILVTLLFFKSGECYERAKLRDTLRSYDIVKDWFCPPGRVLYPILGVYWCFERCEGCPNGFCVLNECHCFPDTVGSPSGYCGKICGDCENGWCSSVSKCECNEGFTLDRGRCVLDSALDMSAFSMASRSNLFQVARPHFHAPHRSGWHYPNQRRQITSPIFNTVRQRVNEQVLHPYPPQQMFDPSWSNPQYTMGHRGSPPLFHHHPPRIHPHQYPGFPFVGSQPVPHSMYFRPAPPPHYPPPATIHYPSQHYPNQFYPNQLYPNQDFPPETVNCRWPLEWPHLSFGPKRDCPIQSKANHPDGVSPVQSVKPEISSGDTSFSSKDQSSHHSQNSPSNYPDEEAKPQLSSEDSSPSSGIQPQTSSQNPLANNSDPRYPDEEGKPQTSSSSGNHSQPTTQHNLLQPSANNSDPRCPDVKVKPVSLEGSYFAYVSNSSSVSQSPLFAEYNPQPTTEGFLDSLYPDGESSRPLEQSFSAINSQSFVSNPDSNLANEQDKPQVSSGWPISSPGSQHSSAIHPDSRNPDETKADKPYSEKSGSSSGLDNLKPLQLKEEVCAADYLWDPETATCVPYDSAKPPKIDIRTPLTMLTL